MELWESIPAGGRFLYEGNIVRKTSPNTFEDGMGIETQFQPILSGRIQLLGVAAKVVEPDTDTRQWLTDPQTRVQTRNPDFGKKLKKPAKKKSAKKAKAE